MIWMVADVTFCQHLCNAAFVCGYRLYPQVVPMLVLKREQLKPNTKKVYAGGRPSGSRPSDAVALVADYFDWIKNEVNNGIGWPTIAKLIKQATGAKFCQKTLSRHWHQERDRRAIHKEAARRSGRASAAKRAEVAA